MQNQKQAWLLAVSGSKEEFPADWLSERSDLMRTWPVGQQETPGIKRGDHFLYYVPGDQQRLIAAGKATGPVTSEDELPVQLYLVVPRVNWGPKWDVSAKASGKIGGRRAAMLDDADYEDGLAALPAPMRNMFRRTV